MSSSSGISASAELLSAFSDAVSAPDSVRFLKISIKNELLVPDESLPPSGTLDEDFDKLGDYLQDDVPAYILVRLDNPPTEWLAVFYVPDTAKVRDKMLYASTRPSLTKALGAAAFSDSLFANSKADLGADAYARHRASLAAPKPMSARELEMEEMKQEELRASESGRYAVSRARASHIKASMGMPWGEGLEGAVKALGQPGEEGRVVIISIDPATETLTLSSATETSPDDLGTTLPASEPCYAFYAWPGLTPRRIVFMYSCPSSSPVKHRMVYSCAFNVLFVEAKALLQDVESCTLLSRKVETSDPKELNEAYLRDTLGNQLDEGFAGEAGADASEATPAAPLADEKKFAKPRGPAKRAR